MIDGKIFSLVEEACIQGQKMAEKGNLRYQYIDGAAITYILAKTLLQMQEYQAELERYRKHRHKTFGEGYSEKPAW